MPTFRASDGEKLSYWDIGQGPVCVMVHGFGMPAFLWLPFVLPLAGRYRFVMPNLRGFGGSHRAKMSEPCAFTQYAQDLHELMLHLKLEKPALVGFSMGGCTTMEYHRLYGFDNISAYLQIDQAMHISHTEQGEHGLFGSDHAEWMHTLRSLADDLESCGTDRPFDSLPKARRQKLWKMFSTFSGSAFHHPVLRAFTRLARNERMVRVVAPTSNWPIYLTCMRSFVEHQRDFRLSMSTLTSRLPVWFFVGDESKMYPAEGQALAPDFIPHARVVRFRNAGHAVMFDSPVRFVRKLDEFMVHGLRRQRRAHSAHSAASSVREPEAIHA